MGAPERHLVSLRGRSPVCGGYVAHQIHGPRDAPPLLLLQGQGNSHHWWDALRPHLANRFLTITFDYRGTGDTALLDQQSTAASPSWSTELFAEDTHAVLTALGLTSCLVYGTSMGGRVAQELAINHPEAVPRLVLACTSPGGSIARERGRDVRLALADPDPARRRRTIVDLFYTPGWVEAHGGHEAVPTHLFGDPGITREAAARHLRASNDHDAADRLGGLTSPTLIIHGDEDRMTPSSNARVLAELIPNSEVRLWPDGRHGFFDEYSPAVTDTVTDFLMA